MVWLNQGVEDNSHFIVEFEQRLKDSFIQKWYQEKETNNKLSYYNMFKTEFKQELYITKYSEEIHYFLCKIQNDKS